MTFVIMLIAVAMERFFYWSHARWFWFIHYERWLSRWVSRWPGAMTFLAINLPLFLLVALMDVILSGIFYDIPRFLFEIAILLYCLGPVNLWVQVSRSLKILENQSYQEAREQAHHLYGLSLHQDPQLFHQGFVRAILTAAYQRIFAVLFWFVLLGPAGAVLYRTIALSATQSTLGLDKIGNVVLGVLDWIPIRLFTFIFALGGHFANVFNHWKQWAWKSYHVHSELLAECGVAALDVMENDQIPEGGAAEKEALALVDRVLLIGLVVLALLVLLL